MRKVGLNFSSSITINDVDNGYWLLSTRTGIQKRATTKFYISETETYSKFIVICGELWNPMELKPHEAKTVATF